MSAQKSEKTAIFRFLGALILPFMYFVGRYELHEPQNVPATGAFVLSPNHYSNIDPIVIGVALWKIGRMPRYMAKASLFRIPVFGWIFRKAEQIPVDRTATDRTADPVAVAKRVANSGHAIVVYPEGSLTRDPDLWPMRGKLGAVRTALEAGVPLIPAASWGAQLILPRYSKRISLWPRKSVHIVFGAPLDLSEFDGKRDTASLVAATGKLMAAITELVESLRDETAPAERWDPAQHGQTEIGRI